MPENNSQAERILDKVSSLMLSKNSGVVLSAIKVMMKMLENLEDINTIRDFNRKIVESLTSFTSREKEINFIALKNIAIIAERQP